MCRCVDVRQFVLWISYLGRLTMALPVARFFVVSKDARFDPLLQNLKLHGVLSTCDHHVVTSSPWAWSPVACQSKKPRRASKGSAKRHAAMTRQPALATVGSQPGCPGVRHHRRAHALCGGDY
jgi:hypothetical protein